MKTSMAAMWFAMAAVIAPAAQAAPAPPPPPDVAVPAAVIVGTETMRIAALMQQCQAALSAAHPWRAAQAQREMFQLKVSMSYRAAGNRLSPQDMASARTIETRAYGNLAATCAPLLI